MLEDSPEQRVASEQPRRHGRDAGPIPFEPERYSALFSSEDVTREDVQRAFDLGLIAIEDGEAVVPDPGVLEACSTLALIGFPLREILDELEAVRAASVPIVELLVRAFERRVWNPMVRKGVQAGGRGAVARSIDELSGLVEGVVHSALRDRVRREVVRSSLGC